MIQRQFVSIFTMSDTEFGREQHPLKRSGFVFQRAIGSFQFFHHTGAHYGATDEFGYRVVEKRAMIHDLHATILYLLGMDHERLTYRHNGRDFRLTDVHGKVIHDIIA